MTSRIISTTCPGPLWHDWCPAHHHHLGFFSWPVSWKNPWRPVSSQLSFPFCHLPNQGSPKDLKVHRHHYHHGSHHHPHPCHPCQVGQVFLPLHHPPPHPSFLLCLSFFLFLICALFSFLLVCVLSVFLCVFLGLGIVLLTGGGGWFFWRIHPGRQRIRRGNSYFRSSFASD